MRHENCQCKTNTLAVYIKEPPVLIIDVHRWFAQVNRRCKCHIHWRLLNENNQCKYKVNKNRQCKYMVFIVEPSGGSESRPTNFALLAPALYEQTVKKMAIRRNRHGTSGRMHSSVQPKKLNHTLYLEEYLN
jgi:hypothetical protein